MATTIFRSALWRNLDAGVAGSTSAAPFGAAYVRFLHEGPDTIDELLDRHLAKTKPSPSDPDEDETSLRRRLTSTRREALALYRDVLRAARLFSWRNEQGVLWRDVLIANARREFEAARDEVDPEVVNKLLIGGREAVEKALDNLAAAARRSIAEKDRGDRRGGSDSD